MPKKGNRQTEDQKRKRSQLMIEAWKDQNNGLNSDERSKRINTTGYRVGYWPGKHHAQCSHWVGKYGREK